MKKHIFTLMLVGVLGISAADAQKYRYDWMKMVTFDVEMTEFDMKIQADDAGNTYSTFSFQWDIHIGRPPKKKKDPEPPILSAGDAVKGVYLDKRDSNGDVVWQKVIRIGDSDKEDNLSILFNNVTDLAIYNGDIYLTGSFDTKADFGNGVTLQSEGRNDMFIAKLDGSGNAVWAIRAGGSGQEYAECDPGGMSIIADASGVLAVGILNAYPNGGGTIGDQPLELSEHGATTTLIKLSHDGAVNWFKKAPAGTFTSNQDLAVDDAGNIYLSGSAQFFAEWDGNKTETNGMRDAVIFKLDKNGGHIWTKVFGFGNGKFDGKTLDNEGVNKLSVSGDGKVNTMITLHDGAEINGEKIKTVKDNALKMETMAVQLNTDGSISKLTRFAGPMMSIPGMLSPGISGANGVIYFKIGKKAEINGEKLKGEGMYAIDANGELTYIMSNGIKDLKVHSFLPANYAMNSSGVLFGIGKVMLTSDLFAQFNANAGKRLEKITKKNYFYDKDFNQGVVLVKFSN